MQPWKTLSSRTIVEDRWLSLRADTCETVEGARIDPYYVIGSDDWVCTLAVTVDAEIVLVRQYRHAVARITLELPGGLMEAGEDCLVAGLRELREETGFGGAEGRLIRVTSPNPARNSNRLYGVLATGVARIAAPLATADEQTETMLWPLARAQDLFLEPDFINAHQAGILAAGLVQLGAWTMR